MKRDWAASTKRLKSPRGMTFVRREVRLPGRLPEGWREFRDVFDHREGVTLCRTTTVDASGAVYVRWTCPTLGGGHAGVGYWLMRWRKGPHRGAGRN
jgi:hypothetical protein